MIRIRETEQGRSTLPTSDMETDKNQQSPSTSSGGSRREALVEQNLRPLIIKNLQEQLTETEEVCRSTNENSLPEEMLVKVFQQLDKASLMNCRLVCNFWKSAIDDSPDLMRHFVFGVFGVHQFLDSTIANKVKKVRLRRELGPDIDLFLSAICDTVAYIELDFLERSHPSQKYMNEQYQQQAATVRRVLSSCNKLNSVKFASSNCKILQYLGDLTEKDFAKVRQLIVNIQEYNVEDLELMERFLMKCSSLESLEYSYQERETFTDGDLNVEARFTAVVIDHINKYPGSLKRLYASNGKRSYGNSQLLAAAIRNNVEIDFLSTIFQICHVLNLRRQGITLTEENCRSFKNGATTWTNFEIEQEWLTCLSRLHDLVIALTSDISKDDLHRLQTLPALRNLYLHKPHPEFEGLPENAFSFGLPKLATLYLSGDVFSSADLVYPSIHKWFPNLTKLLLVGLRNTPVQMVIYLSNIESLSYLSIDDCTMEDNAFIRPCEINALDHPRGEKLIVPAIAAFKNLVKLQFKNCALLTDICLSCGIERCTNLKYLELESKGDYINQFTDLGLKAIKNAGFMKLNAVVQKEHSKVVNFVQA